MNHFVLKFNHGVEIGAHLAYMGHYRATGDRNVYDIAQEETLHKMTIESILDRYGQKPSKLIDSMFTLIGNVIYWLCQISPNSLLNFVARSLELFAVFSYKKLAIKYPVYRELFNNMAKTELVHEEYFKQVV